MGEPQTCGSGVAVLHLAIDAASGASIRVEDLSYTLDVDPIDADCTNLSCTTADLDLGDLPPLEVAVIVVDGSVSAIDYSEVFEVEAPGEDSCGRVSLERDVGWTIPD